jgi:hypothetical protein
MEFGWTTGTAEARSIIVDRRPSKRKMSFMMKEV